MNFPSELKYTEDHEWIKMIDDKTALIGITDFAQRELGDIVFVDIATVGKLLNAEDVFGTVEAVKTVSDLFLPLAEDPYGEGWMAKIEIDDAADLNNLLSAEAYEQMVS